MLVKQNAQASKSYIKDLLMPNIKNKLNKIFFLMIFDEKQVAKVYHQRYLDTLLTVQNHDKQLHRHTNDIFRYQTSFIILNKKNK